MSWCYRHSVLFFIFISTSFQSAPFTKRTLFIRLLEFDGRRVHNWTAVRASSSVWECAGICFAESMCLSVSFEPMSGGCVLYQRTASPSDDFTISPSAVSLGVCPNGFSVMGSWCIKVVTDKLNMQSARDHCRDHNADLITLETQAKIAKFRDFMVANEDGYAHEYYTCGVTEVNGVWQWFNGKTFSSSSDAWCDTEPNIASEKCAAIDFDCLRDIQCHTVQKFVCEIQF